ncbi:MAG TPA: hypothetical protein PK620_06495 [Denitromonas sp.]|uniref:hypothetical protein n=1 Tax=Denitromonas sp. TaxID=2734609 RepID=UPI001D9AE012|nr:hypothetical protein [Rhodocyclaceae bacterium]MCP5223069.1 hypothetical protein [Zoogloeaceae bacterium]HPR07714.1 hypothetical protein [Denitromonas sp.]HQU88365.1 hypothetical protein [Denitromonas sp.]HQV14546.1 hypothetical protein [Denitromonas sp.]
MDTTSPAAAEEGLALAVAAEALYLLNLMVVPGLAFLGIAWMWFTKRKPATALARCHLDQVFFASLWAGVLLVIANAAILFFGGYQSPHTWVIVILYFTTCHTTLICFGAIGLARALAGKPYRFPLIGRPCDT